MNILLVNDSEEEGDAEEEKSFTLYHGFVLCRLVCAIV